MTRLTRVKNVCAYRPISTLGKKNLSLVLTDQGTELKKKNLLADAIATYERALSYDTTNVEAYYNLGVACAEAEEYDRAIIAYENAGRLKAAVRGNLEQRRGLVQGKR